MRPLEFLDVGEQLVGHRGEALGGVLLPEAVFDAMEARELRIGFGLLVVVGPRVDGRVEVGEQLGDRLDRLIGKTGRREELLCLVDLASLHDVGEGGGVLDELGKFLRYVDLVFGDRLDEVEARLLGKGAGRKNERQRRSADKAGHTHVSVSLHEMEAGSGAARSGDQRAADVVGSIANSRKRVEEAAADRLDVFLQRLAIELLLYGDEAALKVRLIADEQKSLIELAGLGDPIRVVEWPPENDVGFRCFVARVGETDVSVHRRRLAFGIAGIIRHIELAALTTVEGRTGHLGASHDPLLFAEGRTIPALDEVADDAHRLIAATDSPGRLAPPPPPPRQRDPSRQRRRNPGWPIRRGSRGSCGRSRRGHPVPA